MSPGASFPFSGLLKADGWRNIFREKVFSKCPDISRGSIVIYTEGR